MRINVLVINPDCPLAAEASKNKGVVGRVLTRHVGLKPDLRLMDYLGLSNSVAIFLAYIFFCLAGQSVALAAEAAAPLVTSAGSGIREDAIGLQGDGINTDATQNSGASMVVAGRVHFVAGEVQAVNVAGDVRTLEKGDSISAGDIVISATESSAQIRMEDGGLIALRSESQLKFDSFKFSGKEDGTENSFFTLSSGGLRAVTGLIGRNNKHSYRITTPTAVIGIIGGTDHEIVYLANDVPGVLAGTYNKVNSGGTTLTTEVDTVNIEPNQMAYSGSMSQLPQLQPIAPGLFGDVAEIQTEDTALAISAAPTLSPLPAADASDTSSVTTQTQAEVSAEATASEEKSADEAKKVEVIEVGEPTGPLFVLAPIVWGGDISESLRKHSFGSGQPTVQNVQALNLRAVTYVWQPWLAQVNGGIGVVNAKNTSGGTSSDENVSLNGKGELSLVPYSRFPFSASYYSTDSRAGMGAPTSNTGYVSKSTGFEVQQRYRPPSKSSNSVASYSRDRTIRQQINSSVGGDKETSRLHVRHDYRVPHSPSAFGVGYDRRTTNADVKGAGIVTGLQGSYSTKLDQQSLEVKTTNTDSVYEQESLRFNNVTARHVYRPDSLLTVTNSATTNQTKLLALDQNSSSTRNLQLASSTSWQPDEELPFIVFGSVRVFDSVFETPLGAVVSQSQIGVASVSYAATPTLRYAVHETLAHTSSGGTSKRTTLTGGSANYLSIPTKLGNAFHSWETGASVDYQTSNAAASNTIISGRVGQSLNLPYAIDEGVMDFNFNQSLSVRADGIIGQTGVLTHNGGVTWRPVLGETLSSAVNFTLADIRSFGASDTHLQTAKLGVNAQHRTSAYSRIVATAALGWSSNNLGQTTANTKIDVKYNHTRAFNVKGLRYMLTYSLNKYQFQDSRIADNARDGYVLDQKLEYGIGRAYLRLQGTINEYARSRNTLIVLQLGRTFGDI